MLSTVLNRRKVLCFVSFRLVRAVSSFSTPLRASPAFITSNKMSAASSEEDPYLWLEEVESEESLAFAKKSNEHCLAELGDPARTETYKRVLTALESDDRIPYARVLGYTEEGEPLLYNFWKDGDNPKGIWRKTTLSSYESASTQWTTVLDLDELGKKDGISWVWKGYVPLPRSLDEKSGYVKATETSPAQGRVTRVLLNLSRGGADATYLKEFDLLTETFVDAAGDDQGFALPEGKTRARYKSRDVLLVGADTGEGSLTSSGYPRTCREWKRGTKIEDAPLVFEGEETDVSCGQYFYDEMHREGGDIYTVQSRSVTFYESVYNVQKGEDGEFVKLAIPATTQPSFFGRWMLLHVKSKWLPEDNGSVSETFETGSFIYVDADAFLEFSRSKAEGKEPSKLEYHVLFEPSVTTSYNGYSATKNYLILYSLDNVKEKMEFYKIGDGGGPFVKTGGDEEGQIRSVSASAIDSKDSDLLWLTTSGYTQPSTLALADASKNGAIVKGLKSLPDMYDAKGLQVTQHFATSKDGTKIPYFMISKKDLVLDGMNPTLLYGYGGFEISLGPRYATTVGISWLERGGVYVEANIRGGGEYGPDWHQSALKANRNKCYEDFIAVGEHLVASKVCTPKTLACRGGSNGGLLTGNMYVQAPELFSAIQIAVPLLDMKRYSQLLAGASWMAEYGDPDTDDWDFLKAYSPYHNIDASQEKYPAVLLTTSTRDDRVHPAHARKFVKRLEELGEGRWPVYYYENIEGGHGGAADNKQQAFMTALAYDFFWGKLNSEKEA